MDIFLYDLQKIYKRRNKIREYINLNIIDNENNDKNVLLFDYDKINFNWDKLKFPRLQRGRPLQGGEFNDIYFLIFPYYQLYLKDNFFDSNIKKYNLRLNPINNLNYDYSAIYISLFNIPSIKLKKKNINIFIIKKDSLSDNKTKIITTQRNDNYKDKIIHSNIIDIHTLDLSITEIETFKNNIENIDIFVLRFEYIEDFDINNIFNITQTLYNFFDKKLLFGTDLVIMLNPNIKINIYFENFLYRMVTLYERFMYVPDKLSFYGNSNLYFINKKKIY